MYWCSIFILPQNLLKDVERLLRSFQWTGQGQKIQWDWVCTPKDEGGFGFKPLKTWNKATMIRHLWA